MYYYGAPVSKFLLLKLCKKLNKAKKIRPQRALKPYLHLMKNIPTTKIG